MAEDSTTNPESSSGSPQGAPRSSGGASPDAAADAALKAAREAIAGLGGMGEVSDTTEDAGIAGTSAATTPKPAPSAFSLPTFDVPLSASQTRAIDLLSDVNLDVKIELGRTKMYVEDLLKLTDGSVVELDKLAGDPVDIYVNDRHVARGEVLVLNDNFCVRINEILAPPSDVAKAA
jgi:flagellar motor switch protein FliN